MRQAYRGAIGLLLDLEQMALFEALYRRPTGDPLDDRELEAVGDGKRIDDRLLAGAEGGQPVADELGQPTRGREGSCGAPYASVPLQNAALLATHDQLAQEQWIAGRALPQLAEGQRVDGPFEDGFDEPAHRLPRQRTNLDSVGAAILPELTDGRRRGLPAAQGQQQRRSAMGCHLVDQGSRLIVQVMRVVHDQQQRCPVLAAATKLGQESRHHHRQIGRRLGQRQQMGDRAEGNLGG